MDVSTRQLRSFVTVAEELSFTRAAGRLHLSQQALSAQVSQLEQTVGATLLHRTTRSVELTSAGAVFLAQARATLAWLDRSAEEARRVAADEKRMLTIGTGEGGALTLTEAIFGEFRARHPDVRIEVKAFSYADPSAGLADASVDVAYLRLPIAGGPWLRTESLFSEPVVAMLPSTHPLSGRARITVADLRDETFIGHVATDSAWIDFWSLASARGGMRPRFAGRASSLMEESHCVGAGMGCVVTAASARWMPTLGTVLIPIDDAPTSEVAIGWRTDGDSDLIRSFLACALAVRDRNPDALSAIERPAMADRVPLIVPA